MAELIISLHEATERGEEDTVVSLLRQFRDDSVDHYHLGKTALHVACARGFPRIASLLLRCGANVNLINAFWVETSSGLCTALHFAADKGCEQTVWLLLSSGADVSPVNKAGWTPLDTACAAGFPKIAKLLLNSGADWEFRWRQPRQTALHRAVQKGCEETVNLLLSMGADVNAVDTDGLTALHYACLRKFPKLVQLLINKGANMTTASNSSACVALHIAALEDNEEAVQLLISNGTDVNIEDRRGWTALHCACNKGHVNIVELLLKNGASVNSIPGSASPLHTSTTSCIDLLLDYGADFNATNYKGKTPLECFAYEQELNKDPEYWVQLGASPQAHVIPELRLYFEARLGAGKALLKQIWKKHAQKMVISKRNLHCISASDDLWQSIEACQDEMESMENRMIGNSTVDFFDFLTESENVLADFVNNEDIVRVLESGDCETEFPVYASLLYQQFLKGVERRDLLQQSTERLLFILNKFVKFPHSCAETINRLLPNSDLSNLLKA